MCHVQTAQNIVDILISGSPKRSRYSICMYSEWNENDINEEVHLSESDIIIDIYLLDGESFYAYVSQVKYPERFYSDFSIYEGNIIKFVRSD